MSNQLNSIHIEGNMTRDPELRYTPSGTPVTSFGLANNRHYTQGEEKKQDTCFVDVVAFGKTAEYIGKYLKKGGRMIVSGRLQHRRWETPEGEKRGKHEIVVLEILNRANRDEQEETPIQFEEPE